MASRIAAKPARCAARGCMLTEKPVASRRPLAVLIVLCLLIPVAVADAVTLSREEARRIGQKIWQNECGGTVAGLTSWNGGENFASLGIGHFIWYPKGVRGPFEESFPELAAFASARGAKLPATVAANRESGCP